MKRRRTRPQRQASVGTLACVGGAMMLLAGSRASAQEALRSSLSYDQAIQPKQNAAATLAPAQSHLGPVQFSLGVYSEADFVDNVNYSQSDPQSDVLLHGGLNTSFTWPATPQSDLSLNTGIGYVHYLRNPQNDSLETQPNSVLNWNVFIDDVSLAFYDQFSYSQTLVSQPALTGVATFPTFDNTVGGRVTWTPSQWLFQAGYSHDNYLPTSSAFSYLDRSSDDFFARSSWQFAENTQTGVEASASVTSYNSGTQSGNTSYSLGPFVEWQITQAIHLTLRGGPTIYSFDSSGASGQGANLFSYYFSMQLNHKLTDFLSYQLSAQRSVNLAANQGGNYLEELDTGFSLVWEMTQHIGLTAGVSYVHGSQTFQNVVFIFPGFGLLFDQTENYDQYSLTPSVTWQATDKLSTILTYNYNIRDSNLAGRGYIENSVSLKLSYAF